MLESLMVILPGIIAIFIYRIFNKEFQAKKLLLYILSCAIGSNFLIFGGLWLIGMRHFNIFEMSLRFKVKWLILEVVLIFLAAWVGWNIRCVYRQKGRHLKKLFPTVLFFIVTYAIFTPSSLFLGNINEFSISYIKIAPILIPAALILAAGIYAVALCFTNEKNVVYYTAVIFSITICAYVQGNFLNPSFPSLDGTAIEWTAYHRELWISTGFWIICIVIVLGSSFLWKEKMERVIKYGSYFLSAIQMVSLIVLLFTSRLDDTVNHGFTKEGEFAVGSQENIIIFIVDTLQASTLDEYLLSDGYINGALDDFTFFDDVVSGGAPTHIAMPLFLTGMEYDPAQSMEEYRQEAWQETSLYDDLHAKGYDVRLYSELVSIAGFSDGMFENYAVTGSRWIGDDLEFGRQLYKLVNFYLVPQPLKKYYWLSTDAMTDLIEVTDTCYKINDIAFYKDLQEAGSLQTDYEKSFRLYHLNGVHDPCRINENIERVPDDIPEQQTLQGIMKIIYAYMDHMKEAGVYESSTIIIAGDHGRHENGNVETNPAFLIKLPYETHAIARNSAPIHFRNVSATIAELILDDYSEYGPSIYDITENSDVERLHTIDATVRSRIVIEEGFDDTLSSTRLIISGTSDGCEYHLWDPYSINSISYQMGDVIDFRSNNDYAKELNYRLYKEKDAAIASNELSICFELEDYSKKDIELHFVCSDVYNDLQKIRIYAGGKKIENVICTKEDIGAEKTVTISSKNVQDGKLAVRMVFPNAVTLNQLDRNNGDTRILSVAFESIWLEQ